MLSADFVRDALWATWEAQACRRRGDWPATKIALIARWGDVVESAIAQLSEQFGAHLPADATATVWRCFPRLDQAHCQALAARLIEEARAKPRLKPLQLVTA